MSKDDDLDDDLAKFQIQREEENRLWEEEYVDEDDIVIGDFNMDISVYCDYCGGVPGIMDAGICPSGYSSHYFKEIGINKTVYCDNCGAVPGRTEAGKCKKSSYHYFKVVDRDCIIYCDNCGGVPGIIEVGSSCPSGYSSHYFKSSKS